MNKVVILLDNSGSMGLKEKRPIISYLLHSLVTRLSIELKDYKRYFIKTSDEKLEELETLSFESIDFKGSLNSKGLLSYIEGNNENIYIFLTDGNLKERRILTKFFEDKKTKIFAITIAPNFDADMFTLNKIFGEENVFLPFDVVSFVKRIKEFVN